MCPSLKLFAAILWTTTTSSAVLADSRPDSDTLVRDPAQLASWLAQRDFGVAAAAQRAHQASANRDQAGVLPNPQLTGSVGGIVLGSTNPERDASGHALSFSDTSNVTVGVSQLVELGKRGPREQAASLRLDEAKEREVASLGTAINGGTLALARVAYLTQRKDTIAADLSSAHDLEKLEQLRVDKGDLAAGELLHLELESSEISAQLRRAEADLEAARATCTASVYLPCSLGAFPADSIANLPAQLPNAATAIAARPIDRADQLEANALDTDAKLAAARRIPDPTFGLAYTYDNFSIAGDQQQTLVASVSIPLPLFDRGSHDAAAARAGAAAARADEQAEIHQASSTVDGLVAQRDRLEASLTQLETQDLPRSKQLVEQTRKAFDLGQARLADLLLAERSDRDLGLEALDLQFDLVSIRVQLRQLLGLDDQLARHAGATS